MKKLILLIAAISLCSAHILGQGWIYLTNARAPTRLWSDDGPLAGSGIWAQFLIGRTPDSLTPIGVVTEHFAVGSGLVPAGAFRVPMIGAFETAYVRMVAWDGRIWGNVLANVPINQQGMTDVVPVTLGDDIFTPPPIPFFTQPAVVPVPEPSATVLALVGIAALVGLPYRRRRSARFTTRVHSPLG